ncbi:MAG: glutathione S-transferase [Betaproteobacteria bacterium RIFCSPLOWO2_12_FULL_65_14]|nr:MAG: glutathione S-transferase [Betaproteobacteria bacterium RIFCSPLOWO2_12_FULL_65_14]
MAIQLYDLAGAEDDRRFSPYCWRIKMALMHKGLPFETVPWRFTDKDAVAFANSTSVPVLVDGGHAVSDSWKIAAYLEQAYPSRPALFGGSDSQALTYFFSHWAVRTLHPLLMRAIVLDLYGQLHEKDRAYFRESREKRFGKTLEQHGGDPAKAVAELRDALEPVRPVVAENDFVDGKGPGFADYILFGVFQWARSVSPVQLLEPGDPLYAWRGRMLELWGGYARKAKGYPV